MSFFDEDPLVRKVSRRVPAPPRRTLEQRRRRARRNRALDRVITVLCAPFVALFALLVIIFGAVMSIAAIIGALLVPALALLVIMVILELVHIINVFPWF